MRAPFHEADGLVEKDQKELLLDEAGFVPATFRMQSKMPYLLKI